MSDDLDPEVEKALKEVIEKLSGRSGTRTNSADLSFTEMTGREKLIAATITSSLDAILYHQTNTVSMETGVLVKLICTHLGRMVPLSNKFEEDGSNYKEVYERNIDFLCGAIKHVFLRSFEESGKEMIECAIKDRAQLDAKNNDIH